MALSSIWRVVAFSLLMSAQSVFAQGPAAPSASPENLGPVQLSGLHRFYRVNEHLYRSAQPTKDGLQALAKMGIKTVIDLRGDDTHSGEAQLLESLGVKYISIPMPLVAAPSVESVKQALALLMDSSKWPVLVHCQRGADRTGTVIACFRISQEGWSNQRALEEASQLGMYSFQRARKQFILDWPALSSASAVTVRAAQSN